MIRTRPSEPRPAAPAPRPSAPRRAELRRIGDSLTGPGRAQDPVAAMAADIAEIAGAGIGVDEPQLVSRGWTAAEIVEHFAAAARRVRGGAAAASSLEAAA